jgi:hypothetical protein
MIYLIKAYIYKLFYFLREGDGYKKWEGVHWLLMVCFWLCLIYWSEYKKVNNYL